MRGRATLAVQRNIPRTFAEWEEPLTGDMEADLVSHGGVSAAALAPKLRLASVLGLTWQDHIDPDLRFITVHRHKTATTTKRPQVVPISEQLR